MTANWPLIRKKLSGAVKLGEQGVLDNIPLPQVVFDDRADGSYILLFSMLDDRSAHRRLLEELKRILGKHHIAAELKGPRLANAIDEPQLRFWGSRLRIVNTKLARG